MTSASKVILPQRSVCMLLRHAPHAMRLSTFQFLFRQGQLASALPATQSIAMPGGCPAEHALSFVAVAMYQT